ncbi:cyclase family protein [Roseomonas harenae]|uniref:cyclase family protein n=1 Tax=Muricoccus harenae TaxID=2692566 RepID=UPI0013315ADB|nr:cyclase family protein [Roseomonas harenae]
MARRVIDLSTPVRTDHFRWAVERRLAKSHEEGAGQATWAGWNVHAFTHMDSPRHVDPTGFTTDAITPDMTVGEGAVLDLTDVPANTSIEESRIASAGAHLRPGDIAILKTRWDERFSIDTPDFWLQAPWMTDGAAEFLHSRGIKAVAFDFPQDYCIRFFLTGERRPPLPEHVTHHRLLARGVIMFEYLANTGALKAPRNLFVGLPIRLPDSDGSPARVIAIEEEPS